MTDVEAISKRDRDWHDPRFARPTKAHFWEFEAATDRHTLLAEIDRLTATPYPEDDIKDERARILAAVEAEYAKWPKGYADDDGQWCLPLAAVIAAIKGETTE